MSTWPEFLTPTIGATGLLTLVVLLVLWGKLVPRSVLNAIVRDKDDQIQTWKQAYEKSERARDIQRQQLSQLLELAKTTTHVIQAIPEAAANYSELKGGRPHEVEKDLP